MADEVKDDVIGIDHFNRLSKSFRSELVEIYDMMYKDVLEIIDQSSEEDTPEEIIQQIEELF